jgi:hypothetical protein
VRGCYEQRQSGPNSELCYPCVTPERPQPSEGSPQHLPRQLILWRSKCPSR